MSQQGEQQPGGRPRPSRQQRLCQLAVRQLVAAGAELPEGTAHMGEDGSDALQGRMGARWNCLSA